MFSPEDFGNVFRHCVAAIAFRKAVMSRKCYWRMTASAVMSAVKLVSPMIEGCFALFAPSRSFVGMLAFV